MSDVSEDKLVARVLREIAKIVEDCDIHHYPIDEDVVGDVEGTFESLAEAIKKRVDELDKS